MVSRKGGETIFLRRKAYKVKIIIRRQYVSGMCIPVLFSQATKLNISKFIRTFKMIQVEMTIL